jgi:hypothetical protein
VGQRWGCLAQDRANRFVIAWAAAPTEEEAAPQVLATPRQRTAGQVGCAWVSDGNAVCAEPIKKVYRDPQKTGRPGRPPLVLRTDVALTQGVKQPQPTDACDGSEFDRIMSGNGTNFSLSLFLNTKGSDYR